MGGVEVNDEGARGTECFETHLGIIHERDAAIRASQGGEIAGGDGVEVNHW